MILEYNKETENTAFLIPEKLSGLELKVLLDEFCPAKQLKANPNRSLGSLVLIISFGVLIFSVGKFALTV